MAARSGMVNLIAELRGMTNAGTADAIIAGYGTAWSDDHLQAILDKYAREYNEYGMTPEGDNYGGSVTYKRYTMPPYRFEERSDGTAVFRVTDGGGTIQGTASYAVNYHNHEITFTANTLGSAMYLTGRAYSLNSAAAEVWGKKAGHYADRYDVSTDNHKLSRSQLIRNAQQQAAYYRGEAIAERVRAGDSHTRVRRIDVN